MPKAGTSDDGRVILFDFYGHDGNRYSFRVSHEAIPTIIETLSKCASAARDLRGEANEEEKVTSFRAGLTPDKAHLALTMETTAQRRVGVHLSHKEGADFVQLVQRELAKMADR